MSIQNIFDPESLRIYDITKPGTPELVFKYHERFDSFTPNGPAYPKDKKNRYGLDSVQRIPGNITDYTIEKKDLLPYLDNEAFVSGYHDGFLHGARYRERRFFTNYTPVNWYFLLGYEIGFLTGYKLYKQGKSITTPPYTGEEDDLMFIEGPSRSMMFRHRKG